MFAGIRHLVIAGAAAVLMMATANAQQIGSHAIPLSETEYKGKVIFGADADLDDYWSRHWDWYDTTYRPYYYGYRSHERRPLLDRSDRYPASYPEYHDHYIDTERTNRVGRINRLGSPSYYYPSTGLNSRLYHWR